jgi:chromatin-remodeling ATPase INO80
MMTFWKKRDKEITDLKRKRDKYEKELRRRQEEEREAVLQKKRLEFIMQQSEIYAHFMSKKLGLSEEQQKQK